jgi:AcrR family transcriptional regulator
MPKIVDHDRYRDELLRGCYALFARHGYASLSMRDVAKELKVSTGTLYHYFPTKQALFAQLVVAASSWDEANALRAVTRLQSPKAKLRAFLRFIEENEAYFSAQHLLLVDYVRELSAETGAGDTAIQAAAAHYVEVLASTLALSHERASLVLTFVTGVVSRRFCDGKHTSFRHQADTLIALLFPR